MVTGFLTQLDLRAYQPNEWLVLNPLKYRAVSGALYTVPAGFVTDLASIPAMVRGIISPNGPSRRAAVLHDWLYCLKAGERSEADALFLEALEAEGVNLFVRRAMWLAVRAGGWMYWNRRNGITGDDFAKITDNA